MEARRKSKETSSQSQTILDKAACCDARARSRSRQGHTVTVHVEGLFKGTTKKFWSTRDSNKPFTYVAGLGKVIFGRVLSLLSRPLPISPPYSSPPPSAWWFCVPELNPQD